MRNVILVGWREFKQKVKSRGFILGSLIVPVIMFVIWILTGSFEIENQTEPSQDLAPPESAGTTIGYVDHADLIDRVPDPTISRRFQRFESEEDAQIALESEEIDAYYVVAEDYRQTGNVQRVSQGLPASPQDIEWFELVLVGSLLPDANAAEVSRLNLPFGRTGPEFISLEPDEGSGEGFSMLPFIVTIAVMLPLFTSGGYLLQSVTQEKSNRIMEILLVSLQPWQMLAGKLAGLGVLTLVQYLIWGGVAFIGLQITGEGATALQGINLSTTELLLVVPYALGGFLLYAGIMAGIGALSADIEGSRGWIFVISLPMMIPLYLWTSIVSAPNGPFAVALSMIPFSAPVAMLMRMTSSAVPQWQLITSLVLLVLTGLGMVWLMARLFRVQTLLSGGSISLKRFVNALQG